MRKGMGWLSGMKLRQRVAAQRDNICWWMYDDENDAESQKFDTIVTTSLNMSFCIFTFYHTSFENNWEKGW
ncbi:hypothetical protein I7I53_11889 [Histoplasma capsulatum var. duboisii H88]|uniref:Uncharacterized protein n=1 Tax=Ajellomyces capsulatus (strain H88) TaxID=544711 RepID=A0A8A1LWP9_AJEC8|nr:hypothetical protein I7I53_11889 [Histoplasma capsulatum var. duboisii H88]